jgi:type IV pilus assembly protein PilX
MSRSVNNLHRQSGAALALSLMMMAVLTLISVASMNTTLLEMLMAGNLQFQTNTLINAENTLTTAEQAAKTETLATYTNAGGKYDITQVSERDPLAMSSSNSITASTGNLYMLEHAGTQTPPGNSNGWGNGGAGTTQEVIRTTAHSEGAKGTVRIVQSIYVK